eukprot:CAMPEP_0168181524 /NCGR_PEP_ID=MMETSP0139_2-20121125/11278_1 /TAXON_ID=44445 /ORGANISM="Pseudo-nitzschia australis, Strain 10249 10 AB" /LENGTH=415 /DNA_ID=CAMNT_0008102137 /DNA_START=66 /DNA_END=1314 /DNA_ORIENTATION=+
MRVHNIFRLLSLASFIACGEAAVDVGQTGLAKETDADKSTTPKDRTLQYSYSGYAYQYGPYYAVTGLPTPQPTHKPTPFPTPRPTPLPTHKPSPMPTPYPSPRPTPEPTHKPTMRPTKHPTPGPIPLPTRLPTPNPTPQPTPVPTIHPTPRPTESPTCKPTLFPTTHPTPLPTPFPTSIPTPGPTHPPTISPSSNPTITPSGEPSENPTNSEEPSENPTNSEEPSENPTVSEEPSEEPSYASSFYSSFDSSNFCGETLTDIICAPRNRGSLGNFCDLLRETGLDETLNHCQGRYTVFAPSNGAIQRFIANIDDILNVDEWLRRFGEIFLDDLGLVTRKLKSKLKTSKSNSRKISGRTLQKNNPMNMNDKMNPMNMMNPPNMMNMMNPPNMMNPMNMMMMTQAPTPTPEQKGGGEF